MSNPTSIAGRTRVSGQILTRPRRGCLAARAGTPGGRVALLVEGPARVGAFDDLGAVGVLFDDRVALVTLDDVLDLGQLVAREDRKAAWVFAHRLVLGAAETHQLVAAQPAAFTEEADQALGAFGGTNALVDLAKRRLVHRHALLLFVLHPASPRSSQSSLTAKRIRTLVPSARWSITSSRQTLAITGNPKPRPRLSGRGDIPPPRSPTTIQTWSSSTSSVTRTRPGSAAGSRSR